MRLRNDEDNDDEDENEVKDDNEHITNMLPQKMMMLTMMIILVTAMTMIMMTTTTTIQNRQPFPILCRSSTESHRVFACWIISAETMNIVFIRSPGSSRNTLSNAKQNGRQ